MADIYLPLLVGGTVHFAQPDAINVSLLPAHTPPPSLCFCSSRVVTTDHEPVSTQFEPSS